MTILVISADSYVGTTIAACFAGLGHQVVNVDVGQEVVPYTAELTVKEPIGLLEYLY